MNRIIVENWATGSKDAGILEKIFYIAVHRQEPKQASVDIENITLLQKPLTLDEAYHLSLDERGKLVRQAGLPLVQDLHLLDAEARSIDVYLDDEKTSLSKNVVECASSAKQSPNIDSVKKEPEYIEG